MIMDLIRKVFLLVLLLVASPFSLSSEPLQDVYLKTLSAADNRIVILISGHLQVLQKGEGFSVSNYRYVLKNVLHSKVLLEEYKESGSLVGYLWLNTKEPRIQRFTLSR